VIETNIHAILTNYIAERFSVTFTADIDADSDLFQLGIIDSHGYLELIRFIESAFNIQFSQREILLNIAPSLTELRLIVEEKIVETSIK
jgi:acyl carrier protein